MKIVVLDGYTENPGDLSWDALHQLGDCTVWERTAQNQIVERAAEADIVLTNKVPLGKAEFDALPKLKFVGVLATGYNIIDLDAASDHNVVVTNIPAYSTNSVAQMVMAHLLNIVNQVQHYTDEVRSGKWSSCPDFCFYDTPVFELVGKTMGIVGLGHIGMAVARIAVSMGMKVLAYTSKDAATLPDGVEKAAQLDDLFAASDVVTLHCPLTDDTRHMVNANRLGLMKKSAILINTGRGPLVDEQALADALNAGEIYAASVDVMSQEPPRADNPLLTARNCHFTPHIAWASKEARVRLMGIAVDNVRKFLAGQPVNVVNKQ